MASRKQIAAARRNIKHGHHKAPSHKASRKAYAPALRTARATYHAARARYHAAGEALGRMEGIHHGKKSRKRKKTSHRKSR